jgi:hypothetical protein
VYAWLESTSDPTDGEWSLATLKEITDVGYKVHFNSMPDSQIVALSPDRVRAEGTFCLYVCLCVCLFTLAWSFLLWS